MADDDGYPDPGWTGWQRIAVGVLCAVIAVTAVILVLVAFHDDEEVPVVPATIPPTTSTSGSIFASTSTTGA